MKFNIDLNKKKLAGIYRILNIVNNKFYIGSAFNFDNRFRTHKSKLKSNKHENEHLQRSYNKYGHDSFIFEILEIVDEVTIIYDIEKEYLDKYFDNNTICYNMNTETDPNKSLVKYNESRKVKIILISPDNILHEFDSYTSASKKINSSTGFIRDVVKGKYKSCKGWRLPENIDYDYINYRKVQGRGAKLHNIKLLSPDGNVYGPIFNMESFSRQHNINSSELLNIIAGRTRYSNGWSLFDGISKNSPIAKNAKTYNITLISPDNIEYSDIKNLTKFCKENKLCISSIRSIIYGKSKKNNHKGWKLKK